MISRTNIASPIHEYFKLLYICLFYVSRSVLVKSPSPMEITFRHPEREP